MVVYTPADVAKRAANEYLGILLAAPSARLINEFPRTLSEAREKKLTTRALEDLTNDEGIQYRVIPRRTR